MFFTAVVFSLAQAALAATPTTTVQPLILSGRQSTRPAGTYSAGITEIIKLLDAKVDAQVIFAYIQNSPIPYNPEATELVALKEHGASTEMMVALLHHGDELRLQMVRAQGAANLPPVAPSYDLPPQAANPPYPSDYPAVADAPYPATCYSYGTGWPVAYWPLLSIGGYRPYGYAYWHHYAPSCGHASSPVVHSGGSRSSGHSGGRSGGRSR
jgi:hypothetical protein